MAGRPRKRAREAAKRNIEVLQAEGAALHVDPAEKADWGMPGKDKPPEDHGKIARDKLSAWWRDQVNHMEHEHRQRRALLNAAAGANGEIMHPHPVFARQVRVFSALGVPIDVIARLLVLSTSDIEACYGEEFATGAAELLGQVAQNLLRLAFSSDEYVALKASIEILHRRGGAEWRPPTKVEIEDNRKPKGKLIDASKLTWEERAQLREIILAAKAREASGLVPAIEARAS